MTKMWTVIFKVYGKDGKNQSVSYQPSVFYNFGNEHDVRLIDVINSDLTGTNEYSIVRISRNSPEECFEELKGQLSDGIFENRSYGYVKVVGKTNYNYDFYSESSTVLAI